MINIASILNTIKGLILGYYTSNSPAVITVLNQYAKDAESRLTNIATGALKGELSYAFVTNALKAETVNLKDQLLSVGEIVAADLEQIINSAVAVFENALKAAIPPSA